MAVDISDLPVPGKTIDISDLPVPPAQGKPTKPTPLQNKEVGKLASTALGMAGGLVGAAEMTPEGMFIKSLTETAPTFTETGSYVGAPMQPMSVEEYERLRPKVKKAGEAISMVAEHPQLIPAFAKAGIQEEWAKLTAGMGHTAEDSFAWGRLVGNSAMMLKNLYDIGSTMGKKAVDILTKKNIEKLLEAQKSGNTAEVNRILTEKSDELKSQAKAMQAAEKSKSDTIKKRLMDHKTEMAKNDVEHNKRQADLERKIAEAKVSLDQERAAELTRIKNAEAEARGKALSLEQEKIRNLHEEHERVKNNATREYQEAVAAEQKLASAEASKLKKDEIADLRRKIDVYNRRVKSNEAAVSAGFPQADGLAGVGKETTPLNVRLVDAIENRIKEESQKIKSSPLYQNFAKRVSDLTKEGKIWGRDNAEGAKLLDKIRKEEKVGPRKSQDELSTYKRNQYARLRKLLEHETENKAGETVSVPVSAQEALNVVSELRKNSFVLQRSGNIRWKELADMADEVERGLRSFVGEEYMPRKAWAELNANMNRLEQFEAGRIAAGRKSADYIPVAEQERLVPIENVEEKMFSNSTNIKSLRTLLGNDEQWYSMIDQHVSNQLSGKTAKEAQEWLKKSTWMDYIDEPSIKLKTEQAIADLQMREGNSVAAHESIKKIEDRIQNSEKNLTENLQKIKDRTSQFKTESEQYRQKLIKESQKATEAKERGVRAAGKEARVAATEAAGQEKAALAEALAPKTENLYKLRRERDLAAAERKSAKDKATQAFNEIKAKNLEAKQEIAASAENRKRIESISKDIDTVVFSRNPVAALQAFKKIRPQLIESGVMDFMEAEIVSSYLAEDKFAYIHGMAQNKAKNQVKKIVGRLAGSVAVGAGVGLPAYVGHAASYPVQEAVEAH